MVVHWWRRRDAHWRRSLFFNATGGSLSAIVFLTAAPTKFTLGAWVALLAIGLIILLSLRIRRHYDLVAQATALHQQAVEIPGRPSSPIAGGAGGEGTSPGAGARAVAESEKKPSEIRHFMTVPVAALDLPGLRALAYAGITFRRRSSSPRTARSWLPLSTTSQHCTISVPT
jgi:hypothetical protein